MKFLVLALIRIYQWTLSPVVGGCCRFQPSCSEYAMEAVRTHGAIAGTWMGLRRIFRCHPFNPGGYDPVPAKRNKTSVA